MANKYKISPSTDISKQYLVVTTKKGNQPLVTQYPGSKEALKYHIDGCPPLEVGAASGREIKTNYNFIFEDAVILNDNLKKTWSGLTLAGRGSGEKPTRAILDRTKFLFGDRQYSVNELLAFQAAPHGGVVSRTTFYNSRTETHDRQPTGPELVIADGDRSFLKVLERPDFQNSDVIGVLDRTADRDKLEDVGNKISELQRWFEIDTETIERFSNSKKGISLLVIKERKK
jgi:hypothetical protein